MNGYQAPGPGQQPVTLGAAGSQDEFLRRLLAFLRDTGYMNLDQLLSRLLRGPGNGDVGNTIGDIGGGGGGGGGGQGGGGCLVGTTPVLMADRSTKLAEDIRVLDEIMGLDFELGPTPQSVNFTHSSVQPCYAVHVEGGEPIEASGSHRWFLANGELLTTLDLRSGMPLLSEGGKPVKVGVVEPMGPKVVYWWNCAPNACFYAGGVLHHNIWADSWGKVRTPPSGNPPNPGVGSLPNNGGAA